jgi:hypothetical protein
MKEQAVAAYSYTYQKPMIMSLLSLYCHDNVIVERELPIHIIRLLWNLLKKKKLVLYVGVVLNMCRALDTKVYHMSRC